MMLAISLGFSGILSACTAKTELEHVDILTQKANPDDRLQVSVLVKYAFTINGFEQAVEEKFPDVDIVQVGNYTRDMGVAEYEARLKNNDHTDIVMTWPYSIGEEYWEESLLDLGGMDFSSRYNISALNEISRDGKLYYLPGPAQVRGIVYNKTLFEEQGWQVPSDFNGFIELCKTIELSGIRSLQLGLKNSEVLDTAFTGYGYADSYSNPLDSQWVKSYEEGSGKSFGDHYGSALDTFQTLIDAGVLRATDLDIDYSEREKMLFTRECAMVEDSVLLARMGADQTGTADEYGLMPFFNPGNGGDWARLYPICYVGLGKQLAEPANAEKYAAVMDIMDYISTPEGQAALMSDTGAMYSSLNGVGAPDVPELDDMTKALEEGRYGVFPELANAQSALREGLAGMVAGVLGKSEVVAMVDKQNALPKEASDDQIILGTATEDFTMIETGGFVADALRFAAGTDFALFLDNGKDGRYNGKGISAKFYTGEVTMLDVHRVLPDLKHGDDGVLQKVSMTGQNLIETLEHSLPVDNDQTGWFYYFSGLTIEFDPEASPGSRIKTIALQDGSALDPNAVYTIAVSDNSVPEEYCITSENVGPLVVDVVSDAIKEAGTISPVQDNRFIVG